MRLLLPLMLLFGLAHGSAVMAQEELEISELSPLDNDYMTQQRNLLQELASRHLGRSFSGDRDRDLALLQTLLDKELVRADEVRELQAMGVILGDLLARELDMHWVVYEDNLGRSRALRYRQTDNYLFPVTMISRRREAGNTTSVRDIYHRAYATIDAARDPLPFQ